MSVYSGSVRSFDDESVTTLLSTDHTDDFDDIEIEKAQAYHVWSRQIGLSYRPLMVLSGTSFARSLSIISHGLRFLLPSFVQSWCSDEPKRPERSHPTAYLDGMRGLAAFAVFLCHLSYGTWDIVHTYGSGAPGENNWFLQLPIVRLFYSGPPMVAIFFVISGYVLSYKPVRLMRSGQHESLMTSTSSSIFRRALRLYLPCIFSTLFIVCLAQAGAYAMTQDFAENMRNVKEFHLKAKDNMIEQLTEWAGQMFNMVNIFDWSLYAGATYYDPHLWTIPVEYRCSLLLFMTHMLTARMSARVRIATVGVLLWWGARWNKWDMTPFWAGQILAELHHIKVSRESINGPPSELAAAVNGEVSTSEKARPRTAHLQFYFYLAIFILGLYLASFPDLGGHEAPGYIWLNSIIPEYWTEKHRYWPNIGAILIVGSAGNLEFLKTIFSSALVQYLGKISFPLYVMHGPVINTFGYLAMEKSYDLIGLEQRWRFELGFFLAAVMIIMAVVWIADIFWRAIDTPCVNFSKWLERKLFES